MKKIKPLKVSSKILDINVRYITKIEIYFLFYGSINLLRALSMSASSSKEISARTYYNLASETEFSTNKWAPANDEVFNKLWETGDEKHKEMISDFLNLFYYFIVCYSKKCFKKHANWRSSRYKSTFRSLTQEEIKFNYELANDNDSHAILLEIQRRMHRYRQEYKKTIAQRKIYLTSDKQRELTTFIQESIDLICTDIQEPVIFVSLDIKTKIAKYTANLKTRQKHKKSKKLNYAVLEALGINVS